MVIPTFDQLMREHMDYCDMPTINMLAEADDNNQNQILIALTSKLYEMIVAKVAKIDYSSVATSRGDISKIENYSQLVETINIIKNIVAEYRCDVAPVATVEKAIENVQQRTPVFKKAFVIGAPVPVVLYNNICINIVAAVSYMIDTCIEYIKNPQSESFQMALDVVAYNKTMECLMFETLKTFNEGCASGDIDEAIKVSLTKARIKREAVESLDEAAKMFDPNVYALKITDSCINCIERERDRLSKSALEEKIIKKIKSKLSIASAKIYGSYFAGGMAASFVVGATMGAVGGNNYGTNAAASGAGTGIGSLSADASMKKRDEVHKKVLSIMRSMTAKSLIELEKKCNRNGYLWKRDKTSNYDPKDVDFIRNCANKVKSVYSESTFTAEEMYDELLEFEAEFGDVVVAQDSPFMTDEDIDNPKMVLHDGEEDACSSPIGEGFDVVSSVLGRGLLVLCKLVIPLIRHIVYLYYFSRQKVSDYFESQAMALEMNAYQLQYNQDMDPEKRQEIYNKQIKIAEKFRKKAMRTSIDYKKSQKEAEKEIAKEQKKFTSADLDVNMDDNTVDNAVTGSVLF